MNNHEDSDIRNALHTQAPFDSEQANAVREKARSQFSKSMRYITRYMDIAVVVMTMITAFCLAFIIVSNNDHLRMIALCYLLIALVSGSIVKLWFWVVNTKISILRDLRETVLAIRGNTEGAWLHEECPAAYSRRRGRFSLLIVLILSGLAGIGGAITAIEFAQFEGVLHSDLIINADGSVSFDAVVGFVNGDRVPRIESVFDSTFPPEHNQFLDLDGRPLAASAVRLGKNYDYTMPLPKPVMPGEWLWFRQRGALDAVVNDDNGTQTLNWPSCVPGKRSFYRFDFTLPPNAELISPKPNWQKTLEDGRLKVTYNREMLQSNRALPFVLKYRLK